MPARSLGRRRFLANVAAVAPLSFVARTRAQTAGQGAIVETRHGRVRGVVRDGVHVFKGVPYGAPPTGRARFMPPSRPASWTGVREAVAYGPRAPQPPRAMIPEIGDALVGSGPMGEDCLSLNVWTPEPGRGARPVMVWFHGGGYRSGSANSIFYDGWALAKRQDVVVVTVNHRLNVLGFLHLAGVGGSRFAGSGNVGLLDLVAALEWVRDNIAAFGGDPRSVTAWGQSGGGGKVAMLMGMPAARGLFHRAIVMSTLVESGVRGLSLDAAASATRALLDRLGLPPVAASVTALQDLPIDALMRSLPGASGVAGGAAPGSGPADDISTRFYPVVDGGVLPAHPFDPVAPAQTADVPILVGSDETEGIPYGEPGDPYWTSEIASDAALNARLQQQLRVDRAAADRIISRYREGRPDATPADLAAIITGDLSGSRESTQIIADRKAAQGRAPVYTYYFQWRSPVRGGKLRTMHSMELPFVFDHVDDVGFLTGTGADRYALATEMSTAFATFARTGTPAAPGLPVWRPYDATARPTLVFGAETRLVNDPYGGERRVLESERARAARF